MCIPKTHESPALYRTTGTKLGRKRLEFLRSCYGNLGAILHHNFHCIWRHGLEKLQSFFRAHWAGIDVLQRCLNSGISEEPIQYAASGEFARSNLAWLFLPVSRISYTSSSSAMLSLRLLSTGMKSSKRSV